MKRSKLVKMAMALLITASLASCGSDNSGSGNSGGDSSIGGNSSVTGNAGEVKTTSQLISAVSGGKFAAQSNPGTYKFIKKSSGTRRSTCFFGSVSYNLHEFDAYRVLHNDGSIQRDIDVNYCNEVFQFSFADDEKFGYTIGDLKSNLVNYIQTAVNSHSSANPTVKKLHSNGSGYYQDMGAYVDPNTTCFSYDYACQQSKDLDTKAWAIKIGSDWYIVDLTKALIQNPVKSL